MKIPFSPRSRAAGVLAAGALVGLALTGRMLMASDHQDTPEVELAPRFDINDVYAFPGSHPNRIVLALSAQAARPDSSGMGALRTRSWNAARACEYSGACAHGT